MARCALEIHTTTIFGIRVTTPIPKEKNWTFFFSKFRKLWPGGPRTYDMSGISGLKFSSCPYGVNSTLFHGFSDMGARIKNTVEFVTLSRVRRLG